MARLLRFAWPALIVAWVVAFAAAGGGQGVGGTATAAALLVAFATVALLSFVDSPSRQLAVAKASVAPRSTLVLRSTDPDAAGRPRPRAPGV
jgi:hypothetical protein